MTASPKYEVIVVDPPWAYGSAGTGSVGSGQAEATYATIGNAGREVNRNTGEGVEEIVKAAPVTEWAASNSHLYLWTTNPKLPFAFAVMKAWGFTYKTTLTWVKTTKAGAPNQGGMGWFFRGCSEHVLFGVRGNKPIAAAVRRANVFLAPTTGHSKKPELFYDILDGIYTDERRIDVFARRSRLGWSTWGDEAPPLNEAAE